MIGVVHASNPNLTQTGQPKAILWAANAVRTQTVQTSRGRVSDHGPELVRNLSEKCRESATFPRNFDHEGQIVATGEGIFISS